MSSMDDENRIENLKSLLDSRVARRLERKHVNLTGTDGVKPPETWNTAEEQFEPHVLASEKTSSIAFKVFLFSIVFFLIAVGVAVAIYFKGLNIVSPDNIEVTISGPTAIDGGAELNLDVAIKNRNNTDIDTVNMRVEYPEGTRNPNDVSMAQERTEEYVGDLKSGGIAHEKIRAIIFGEEQQKKTVKVVIDYRVKGSNSPFSKEKTFDVAITSSPVTIRVESLKEINTGQPIEFTVDVTSNSPSVLRRVLLRADYGSGFAFSESIPKPFSGQGVWFLGDIRPGEKKSVKVRGVLEGQDGEERAFHFSAGIQGITNETAMEPEFLSVAQTVSIKKPFIGVTIALNDNIEPQVPINAGKLVHGEIRWINNLPTKVNDLRIQLALKGSILNKGSVKATKGFYNSIDNTISWDKNTVPELALVSPGDSGVFTFDFGSQIPDINNLSALKNSEIVLIATVKGKRLEDTSVPLEAFADATKKARVMTDLALTPRVVYSVGPFTNRGPVPPKVEKETTYSVVLNVTSTLNDVRNAVVSGTIPFYVKWLDQVNPATEGLTFDKETGKFSWNVGEVRAGTGFSTSPRQVTFQISFTPSLSQAGSIPALVNDLEINGVDRFTLAPVRITKPPVTIRLTTDPQYSNTSDVVEK